MSGRKPGEPLSGQNPMQKAGAGWGAWPPPSCTLSGGVIAGRILFPRFDGHSTKLSGFARKRRISARRFAPDFASIQLLAPARATAAAPLPQALRSAPGGGGEVRRHPSPPPSLASPRAVSRRKSSPTPPFLAFRPGPSAVGSGGGEGKWGLVSVHLPSGTHPRAALAAWVRFELRWNSYPVLKGPKGHDVRRGAVQKARVQSGTC